MNIHVHVHHHDRHIGNGEVVDAINDVIQNTQTIMGQLDDLKAESAGLRDQVTVLQTSLDNEQAQIAALLETNATEVTRLNSQIATLEAQVANSVDPAALQIVIDELKTTRESLVTTKADLESTVADNTGGETGGGEGETGETV